MKRWLISFAAIVGVTGAGALAYIYSGMYHIGADTPHWPVTTRIVEILRERSIERRMKDIKVPDLQGQQLVLKGAGQYAAMCVECHLAPGMKDSEIRPGLYPQPPNLSQVRIDPRMAFWVTKHGIKMSAMPAWGLGHDDEAIWSIVAFLNKLPDLSPEQYRDIVAKAPPDEEMKSMDSQEKGTATNKRAAAQKNAGSGMLMQNMPGIR